MYILKCNSKKMKFFYKIVYFFIFVKLTMLSFYNTQNVDGSLNVYITEKRNNVVCLYNVILIKKNEKSKAHTVFISKDNTALALTNTSYTIYKYNTIKSYLKNYTDIWCNTITNKQIKTMIHRFNTFFN